MKQNRMTISVNAALANAVPHRSSRWTTRILPLVAVVLVAGGTALPGVAVAEPEGDLSFANSPTLSLRTIGLDSTISLYGIEGVQTLSVPVQPGLTLAELVATVSPPV